MNNLKLGHSVSEMVSPANSPTNEALVALAKKLPLKLRLNADVKALTRAVEENVMSITDDGKLEWLLANKTLLAYFCGKMWCGDGSFYNRYHGTWIWKMGKGNFPEKDLSQLFGISGLRNLRRQRSLCQLPFGFDFIDSLFSSII